VPPTANLERRMLLGLCASGMVLLGWYGAHLVDAPPAGTGSPALLAALLGLHGLLASAAFAPANCLARDRSRA
jgi:hypothetical protein